LKQIFYLTLLLALAGCGTVSAIRPLNPGKRALAFSVGGPIAEVPNIGKLPLPYTQLRYRWGIIKGIEAHVSLHPTMLAFGTLGVDAGASFELLEQKNALPSVCIGLNPTLWVNPFNAAGGFKPQAEGVLSWRLSPAILSYCGAQAFFQLKKPYVPFAVMLGSEFLLGHSLGLSIEAKWFAPLEDSKLRVINFPISPGDRGAIGAVVGITFYPGGKYE